MPTFQIQFRRDTTANWESCNPVLLPGELGLEFKEDGTRLFKIGDGNTAWMDLPYCSGPKGDKFEFSDFTPEQLEMLKGPKGDAFVYSDFTPAQLAALVGPKGDDGAAPEHKWEGTTLQFKNADGSWGQAVDLKGPKGDTTVSALPIATDSVLGGVKVSTGLSVTADGVLTVNKATTAPVAAGTATVGTSDKFALEDHVHPAQSVPAAATATPKAPGTAAVGTSAKYAREDHAHPLQTSVSGNAGTATKLATARKINNVSFDGSADITIPVSDGKVASKGTRTTTGNWNITGLKIGVPLFVLISRSSGDSVAVLSATAGADYTKGECALGQGSGLIRGTNAIFIPTATTVTINVSSISSGVTLAAFQ